MQTDIINYHDNSLNSFLKDIKTKAEISSTVTHKESTSLPYEAWFFDPNGTQNKNHFFLKHAQCQQTSLNTVYINRPEKMKPEWCDGSNLQDLKKKEFEGKSSTISLNLKELYFSFMISNSMKEDIYANTVESFKKHIENQMHNEIIKSYLYGKGKEQPEGILNETKAKNIKIKKNEIISAILDVSSDIKQQNLNGNNPIIIMNPRFHHCYLNEILKHNNKDIKYDFLMGMPIYITPFLTQEHGCVIIDLNSSCMIAYNPVLTLSKVNDVFHSTIGFVLKFGVYSHNIEEHMKILNNAE